MEVSLTSALPMLLLLPLLCFLCLGRWGTRKQSRGDGLKSYPIVGTLPHFVKNQHRLIEWSAGVLARCPTHTMSFNFRGLGLAAGVMTANPANVEYVARTNFENYPKGEFVVSVIEDLLGHGIFNSDGDQWLSQRKAASYEFSRRSMRNFVVTTVRSEIVERLLPLLSRAERDGRTLDVQQVLERFAFDNISRVVFDEDPACLGTEEEGMGTKTNGCAAAEFMRALSDAQSIVMARFMSPVKWAWRVQKLLDVGPERRMREAVATIHGNVDRAVRERGDRGAAAGKDDFLSRFAAGGELSDEGLRDVVTNFIVAGRDTTSSALTWFFWTLAGRPDVEERIVREIHAVRTSSGVLLDAVLGFEELREMQYLHAAISESMRLYPPVAMDTHCSLREDTLPDGTFVGRGWQVTYSAYAMARLEEIWGADCEEFRPERWLDGEGVFRPVSMFKYTVFHAGPRMCLGKELAYIQMKSIVASVLERFSFRLVEAEKKPGLVFSLTLRMEGGLQMQVKKRGTLNS